MASLEGEEQAVRALGPAVDAVVQVSLGPAVGAAAAAVDGAARAAATAATTAAGGGAAASPEAFQSALEAAMQPVVQQLKEVVSAVRSSEGQLVRAVQEASAELRAAVDAVAIQQYNATAAAHNIWAMHEYKCSTARLMLLKNSSGKLPKGVTLRAIQLYGVRRDEAVEFNALLAHVLRFYGVDSGSIATEPDEALRELRSRIERLRQVLCTA